MSLRSILRFTAAGRVLMVPVRFVLFGVPHLWRQFVLVIGWTLTSKEYYNWTYPLTELNQACLASYVAAVCGQDIAAIEGYLRELQGDQALRSLLVRQSLASPDRHSCDVEPKYGRRLGWYALVRATKPRVIVETGVDRGLGTAVLAAALAQNAKEGHPGMVYGTDIVADCGHLLAEPYKQYCRILVGDSLESLKGFSQPVDIFIHDSDHRPEYEMAEFHTIQSRLHPVSLILSDNAHETLTLREFAAQTGRQFLYFQEQPQSHWWPGAGIGVAFKPGIKMYFPELGVDAVPPAKKTG